MFVSYYCQLSSETSRDVQIGTMVNSTLVLGYVNGVVATVSASGSSGTHLSAPRTLHCTEDTEPLAILYSSMNPVISRKRCAQSIRARVHGHGRMYAPRQKNHSAKDGGLGIPARTLGGLSGGER